MSSLHKIPQSYVAYTETKLEELVTSALHRDVDSCSKMVWEDDKNKDVLEIIFCSATTDDEKK